MRYFGSKTALAQKIHRLVAPYSKVGVFCDPFGGIGCVGSYFKAAGFDVVTGDTLVFAHLFQVSRIVLNAPPPFRKLRTHFALGTIEDVVDLLASRRVDEGWFTRTYARKRKFFTPRNARAIESCWTTIGAWFDAGLLTARERALLLASLIDSADRVANTAGTYYAYLKHWHRKALRPFEFKLLSPVGGRGFGTSYNRDAREVVRRTQADVLYLDPPYNQRSYGHYYHLPETLARGTMPGVHGAAGMPNVLPATSPFNRRADAADALSEILKLAKARVVVLHYAPSGLISDSQIRALLSRFKSRCRHMLTAPGYTTEAQPRRTTHSVYIATNG